MTDIARIDDLKVTFATDGEPVVAVAGISLAAHAAKSSRSSESPVRGRP